MVSERSNPPSMNQRGWTILIRRGLQWCKALCLIWDQGCTKCTDHLCRVKRRGYQDTPHGGEGNPHTRPRPLVPCIHDTGPTLHNSQRMLRITDRASLLKGHAMERNRTNLTSKAQRGKHAILGDPQQPHRETAASSNLGTTSRRGKERTNKEKTGGTAPKRGKGQQRKKRENKWSGAPTQKQDRPNIRKTPRGGNQGNKEHLPEVCRCDMPEGVWGATS
jgi:hypothetical protein